MLGHLVVHVTDEMNQAFLLEAANGIVSSIKIRHQDTGKILEHLLYGVPCSGRSIKISHLLQASENPDIAFLAFDANSGLIDMQQATGAEPFQHLAVGALIGLGSRNLEFVYAVARDVQTKQLSYAGGNANLRKLQVDILVYRVRDEIRTVLTDGQLPIGRVEGASARWASIASDDVASNPPLHPMAHKSKVDDGPHSLAMRIDQIRVAGRTRRRS